ncbi:AraC-type DNA-binding protein [Filimonas lacunae]|uniref:AraC-type DNA-binding protein n=1 Tax=Filimonas lacunae TaxID=477680 RepID=A0A173MAJ8_9BACT|nr:helix-turn-helix domain-containing protein [Filimonas lacunae]BAV04488.1 transcriptional regulator, AraC family [Filimonas lacunae]SIT31563.1 AraC-type DNA-binding protein [Filimonas lacunae]
MSSTSVLRHTVNELIETIGEAPQPDGLHVYIQKTPEFIPEIPILYPHRMADPLLFLVLDGEMTLKMNLVEYTIRKNEFLFISPNTIRQFISHCNDSKMACMCFSIDFMLKTGIAKSSLDPSAFISSKQSPHLVLTSEEANTISQLMQLLYERNITPANYPFREERLIHCFGTLMYELAAIHTNQHQKLPLKLTRKEEISASFLNLLTQHFKEQRSLQFYADLLFITPKYLTQTIKDILGKTAGEMIDEMVITEAKVLLHSTSHSIAQVAESLYFSDQFFFSKFFKNQTGLTPTEYRKVS